MKTKQPAKSPKVWGAQMTTKGQWTCPVPTCGKQHKGDKVDAAMAQLFGAIQITCACGNGIGLLPPVKSEKR
jgi:hypothetical protein